MNCELWIVNYELLSARFFERKRRKYRKSSQKTITTELTIVGLTPYTLTPYTLHAFQLLSDLRWA